MKNKKQKKPNSFFRFGLFTASLCTAVVLLTILLAMFAQRNSVTFDITSEKVFSLSEQTLQVVKSIKKPVTLFYLEQQGAEDERVLRLLKTYTENSDFISLEYRNPDLYPDFINFYKTPGRPVNPGSILVVCGDKFQMVDYFSFYSYDENFQVNAFKAEQNITRSLLQVAGEQPCMLYVVKQNGAIPLSQDFIMELLLANYSMQEVEFSSLPSLDKKNAIVLFIEGQDDISEEDLQILIDWQESGGKACLFISPEKPNKQNRDNLLAYYGLKPVRFIIAETNPSFTLQGNPLFIIPVVSDSEVLRSASLDVLPVVSFTAGFTYADYLPAETARETLLSTTRDSICVDDANSTQGPFILATSLKQKNSNSLIFFSSSSILNGETNTNLSGGGNNAFLQTCFNWLQDSQENVIPPVVIKSDKIFPSTSQKIWGTIYSIVFFPIIIVCIAVFRLHIRKVKHSE